MTERPPLPEPFAHLVDLASGETGGFVLFATDDYFAEKENLLKLEAPVWIGGKYTDKGKWMDGWESQRRRIPGHDWAVIRLGLAGSIHGFCVDTTHFKGNAPEQVSIEALESPPFRPVAELLEHPDWKEIVPRTPVKPDFPNLIELPHTGRVTHVKLRIYSDGGVARLRAYGRVIPEARTFHRPGSLDLGAIDSGGTIAAVSDQFFGPPANLLLPGRGVNMGDGWETKRRRTPGSDWCVIKLGRRGIVDRIQLDTHFFKGNAPQHVLVEALDEEALGAEEVARRLRAPEGWTPFVDEHPLEQHRQHELEPARRFPVTHLRVHIFPHGGVNRMRFYGRAVDTPEERTRLQGLNAAREEEARTLFQSFCGSKAFAERMLASRPLGSIGALFEASEGFWDLSEADWLEAFAAHPRLGTAKKADAQTERSAEWSKGEQSGIAPAERLAELNEQYFAKFGFVFLLFATGRTSAEVQAELERRLPRSRAEEIATAAREQAKITRLRIEKWLGGGG